MTIAIQSQEKSWIPIKYSILIARPIDKPSKTPTAPSPGATTPMSSVSRLFYQAAAITWKKSVINGNGSNSVTKSCTIPNRANAMIDTGHWRIPVEQFNVRLRKPPPMPSCPWARVFGGWERALVRAWCVEPPWRHRKPSMNTKRINV